MTRWVSLRETEFLPDFGQLVLLARVPEPVCIGWRTRVTSAQGTEIQWWAAHPDPDEKPVRISAPSMFAYVGEPVYAK